MIRIDFELMWRSFEVVMPGRKAINNGQHFFIIDFIVEFSSRELAAEKGTGVQNPIIIVL